jgi:hypothetical protein
MAKTITQKTKKKAKERPKDAQPTGIKEGRELVPFMVGCYLAHILSNVTGMQTMRSNRRSKTSICYQCNLPLYNEG